MPKFFDCVNGAFSHNFLGGKSNSQCFLKCGHFDRMVYQFVTPVKVRLIFFPRQETQMAALQIYVAKKQQTKLQEAYYKLLKHKNEIIFAPSFVFI